MRRAEIFSPFLRPVHLYLTGSGRQTVRRYILDGGAWYVPNQLYRVMLCICTPLESIAGARCQLYSARYVTHAYY